MKDLEESKTDTQAASVHPVVIRTSDDERVDWTPCCGVEFRGDIVHGDKCPACDEVMMWCRGCGEGEGHEYNTCDECGVEICGDCEPYRDDEAPNNFCENCWEKEPEDIEDIYGWQPPIQGE